MYILALPFYVTSWAMLEAELVYLVYGPCCHGDPDCYMFELRETQAHRYCSDRVQRLG